MTHPSWRLGVDIGGTFADCVAIAPNGERRRLKLLTDGRARSCATAESGSAHAGAMILTALPPWSAAALVGMQLTDSVGATSVVLQAEPHSQGVRVVTDGMAAPWFDVQSGEEAPVLAARLLTGTPPGISLPNMRLHVGTTRGTNALLEGRTDRVALFVNEGLEGLLTIGSQQRLGLFDCVPKIPPKLADSVYSVRCRRRADGRLTVALDEEFLRREAKRARANGLQHAAVALIHAPHVPEDEVRVACILNEEGFRSVSVGASMSKLRVLLTRAQTAAVNACLDTAINGLIKRISQAIPTSTLCAATSAGSVIASHQYSPKDSLLSGPAVGCSAARAALQAANITQAITFDMGGTSTDVARIDAVGLAMRETSTVAGITVASPSVDVHSVAAGGGSICSATREGLFVGPASAGAHPGPACYGQGGPLTVTDVNLLLGRLPAEVASMPLDRVAAEQAAQTLATNSGREYQGMLCDLLALANEHMASAVRAVTLVQGHDPREFTLAVFGGAGGQHGCSVADTLGIKQILIVPHAGFVSGEGVLVASESTPQRSPDVEHDAQQLPLKSAEQPAPKRMILHANEATREMTHDQSIQGPAMILETGATICVDCGWEASMHASGALLVRRVSPPLEDNSLPVDVVAARCTAIASWMAAILQRTALSVNIKDRLDFSCGVLDRHAQLCANAPNVPVHLGALGACVRAIISQKPIAGDEIILTNHPAFGGSHLPDLTVVCAVDDEAGTRIGYLAARAHHAEIGGIRPGSMPPDAKNLSEEGVAIAPVQIAADGKIDQALVRNILCNSRWPSRDIDLNLADISAAVAALRAGSEALRELARVIGSERLADATELLLSRSAARTRRLACNIPQSGLSRTEILDDGTPIVLHISRTDFGIKMDFTGSGGVHTGNLNAPVAVVRSAVLYCLRLLAGMDETLDEHRAPLNEGFLSPVELVLPLGILNPPFTQDPEACPAVFAGNTETSQRVVDAVLGAWQVAAGSQGTMNNLVIASDTFSIYETMGGGAGATLALNGTDAVHVHMTNTRLTDPETMELRAPVVLERLSVRPASGGDGLHAGGHGLIRRIRVNEECQVCFAAQRRTVGPDGLAGGASGKSGSQRIIRANGSVEEMPGVFVATLRGGDAVEIQTPGGGGAGRSAPCEAAT